MPLVFYCVACIAWQTHRDHVVRQRHWRRRPQRLQQRLRLRCQRQTFSFCSVTFEGMY